MTADESKNNASHGDAVDWRVAQRLTGNDEALLASLTDMFPDESARHLAAIRAAIAARDAATLARAAHTLKSAAGMFGANALAALALAMEQLGKKGDLAGARDCLAKLDAETARVLAALERGP